MNEVIVFTAEYLIYALLTAAIWLGWHLLPSRRQFLVFLIKLGITLAAVAVIDSILSLLFPSVRPFIQEGVSPLFPHEGDSSFPSSHTAYSAAIAVFIWSLRKKWGLVALVGAVLVGVARVLALVHYPIDVVFGFVLGLGVGVVVLRFWPGKWGKSFYHFPNKN